MEVTKTAQIFISHTKRDSLFCDAFDRVVARVGMPAFRSEFENIQPPAWQTIKEAVSKSAAVFLLIGPELVKGMAQPSASDWKYTQNWIAYEVGLACERGIDVWVLLQWGVEINFPVPYFNNYGAVDLEYQQHFQYTRTILQLYKEGSNWHFPIRTKAVVCPYNDCRMHFNLHKMVEPGGAILCPQCLREMQFEEGFKHESAVG